MTGAIRRYFSKPSEFDPRKYLKEARSSAKEFVLIDLMNSELLEKLIK